MIPDALKAKILPYLGDRLTEGTAVLFTGAGFSLDAKNISDTYVPSGEKVRTLLWDLCFPGEALDDKSSLQDVYSTAQAKQGPRMTDLLKRSLSVSAGTLPDYYQTYFAAPWQQIYTLNIDDLENAAQTQFSLPRRIHAISAASRLDDRKMTAQIGDVLNVVHLNGTLDDLPNDVTFTRVQYGSRAGQQDPWYSLFVSELMSRCVVFLGSKLDESLMWQHIQMRRERGDRRLNELRPRSYLVSPSLDAAKRELLQQFNIVWIQATAEEFANEILVPLRPQCEAGLSRFTLSAHRLPTISLVSELATTPHLTSEFLMGAEPIWSDLQSGRAVEREHDIELSEIIKTVAGKSKPGVLVITGTAGSGKSTALMRTALALSSAGKKTGWIDKDSDLTSSELRKSLREDGKFEVLAIDDADIFGRELSIVCAELNKHTKPPLVLLGVRSSRVERCLDQSLLANVPYVESAVPHLTDGDIGKLIDTLDLNNRLGALKGMVRSEQYAKFRDLAGRQLLIAMLTATSAIPFKEKPIKELGDLEGDARFIYSIVCVSTAFREPLHKFCDLAVID